MKKQILLGTLLIICTMVQAQHKIGVRAGLNYSQFGSEDQLEQGEDLSLDNGFHFGINYTYLFNKTFGVRGELLYIQKRTRQTFVNTEEPVYNFIRPLSSPNDITIDEGFRNSVLSASNAYLSIPVTLQVQATKKLEVYGGISIDLLLIQSAQGNVTYTSAVRPDEIFYNQSLDFNYRQDEAGELDPLIFITNSVREIFLDGAIVQLPSIATAYYDYEETPESRFKGFDSNLIAGINYFIRPGFYIGPRIEYGLIDITRNSTDVSLRELDANNDFIFRDDFDRNINFSLSIGFRF